MADCCLLGHQSTMSILPRPHKTRRHTRPSKQQSAKIEANFSLASLTRRWKRSVQPCLLRSIALSMRSQSNGQRIRKKVETNSNLPYIRLQPTIRPSRSEIGDLFWFEQLRAKNLFKGCWLTEKTLPTTSSVQKLPKEVAPIPSRLSDRKMLITMKPKLHRPIKPMRLSNFPNLLLRR